MDKDKALDLALEALEEPGLLWRSKKAITAIKQARALDKMAENARALGLDYEPVGWWDAKIGFFEEKHFDQLQPLYTTPPPAQPAPVQEPVAKHYMDGGHLVYPTAQRQWVGLTDEEMDNFVKAVWGRGVTAADFIRAIEAKLKEKNCADH